MSINFATSARGFVKIKLISEDRSLNSVELFGDKLDKTVPLEGGDPADLSGKPVTLEITMRDAELFSFRFQ